jgi:hypothetical protein
MLLKNFLDKLLPFWQKEKPELREELEHLLRESVKEIIHDLLKQDDESV